MSGRLSNYGIHVDELSRLRVLDEDTASHANDLRDSCHDFVGDLTQLTDIADGFIKVFDAVSDEVMKEKVKAIGAQNRLQTSAKNRETQMTQLTALIREKQHAKERLSTEHAALLKVESDQRDFIDQFVLRK